MNLVCTNLRSRLSVKHTSSLMFIALSGPPLALWKPLPFVKSWLALYTKGPSNAESKTHDASLLSSWNAM